MQYVLIAGEKLRNHWLRAPQHAIRRVAANHQPLRLLHLQLRDSIQRPRQRNVNPRHYTRLNHFAEARHNGLLIGRDKEHAAQNPDPEDGAGDSPPVPLAKIHCAFSPRIRIFNNSESELRIAVVLSSSIFLYDSSVRISL